MNTLNTVTNDAEVYNDPAFALLTISFFESHLRGYQRTHHATCARKIALHAKKSHWFDIIFFFVNSHWLGSCYSGS